MVKNGDKSICIFKPKMCFFDELILARPRDGKLEVLIMLLDEVGFSHNILNQHFDWLAAKHLIVRDKTTSKDLGDPDLTTHVPIRKARQAAPSSKTQTSSLP